MVKPRPPLAKEPAPVSRYKIPGFPQGKIPIKKGELGPQRANVGPKTPTINKKGGHKQGRPQIKKKIKRWRRQFASVKKGTREISQPLNPECIVKPKGEKIQGRVLPEISVVPRYLASNCLR